MVSRYFLLSGIPLNRLTICDEIQNMISYLVENLRPGNSKSVPEEGKENLFSIFFVFFDKDDNILLYKFFNSFKVQVLRTGLVNMNFPDWDIFEFITKKEGRRGPSKKECIGYYSDELVF